jgi:hypothetical protein
MPIPSIVPEQLVLRSTCRQTPISYKPTSGESARFASSHYRPVTRHNFKAESWYWELAAALLTFAVTLKLKLFFVILVANLVLFWVSSGVLQKKSQPQL